MFNDQRLASFFISLLLTTSVGYSQEFDYRPAVIVGDQIVVHTNYMLSYSEDDEQASWVAYELTKDEVQGSVKRTNDFRPDPDVKTGSAQLSDYKGSGYDRGHLAPAGDMKFSSTAMSESFYMSNMSPQEASFNRGIWRKLEELVRKWAVQNEKIYIVSGGVLDYKRGVIGSNVTVPGYYYKVILDYTEPDIKSVAFVIPNEGVAKPLTSFAVTIDKVEQMTGIDFFPALPDQIEADLEGKVMIEKWNFEDDISQQPAGDRSTAIQCKGIAKSTGVRCKLKTKNENGYCHHHQSQATGSFINFPSDGSVARQCTATTKAGTRCKRKTTNPIGRCWQHE